MTYGELKVDSITFTDDGSDVTVSVSGLVKNPTFSGDIVVSGNISGITITGDSAGFGSVTGVTVTGTTANFVSGVFTSQVSGAVITGNTAGFTTVTGTTVTGTTANFVTVSGTTVTGNAGNFITATVTSGLFASGTQTAPSISFAGDTDTGFYNAAANEVRITTSGDDRLTVDDTGNVGIGTTSPGAKLDVTNDSGTGFINLVDIAARSANQNPLIRLIGRNAVNTTTTSVDLYKIYQGGFTVGNNDTAASNYTSFNVGASERLRITSDGKLGLGTSSPDTLLHLSSGANTTMRLTDTAGSYSDIIYNESASVSQLILDADPAGSSSATGGTSILLKTDGATAMTIDSSQRVGIGTSSPGAALDVRTGANNTAIEEIAVFARPDAAVRATIQKGLSTGNGISFGTTTGQPIALRTDNTERLYIDNTGNVGIGTTSPLGILHARPADECNFVVREESTALVLSAETNNGRDSNRSMTLEGADFVFNESGSEKARIDSSGRLLVGTSTARTDFLFSGGSAILQCEGISFSTSTISSVRNSNDVNGGAVYIGKSRGTTAGSNTIVQENDNLGTIYFAGADGDDLKSIGATIGAEVDGTPGTDDMPGRLVFSTTADGASSPTERMRISSNGAITALTSAGFSYAVRNGTTNSVNTILSCINNATSIDNGTAVFVVRGDGDCENANNSYGALSDIKLKENIVDAGSQWNDLKALQIRKYNFKAETGYNTHTQIGLVAQEVELVSPGLVGESIDEETGESTKSVNYSVLYMKAVKALQEAMERIETLEQRLTDAGIA